LKVESEIGESCMHENQQRCSEPLADWESAVDAVWEPELPGCMVAAGEHLRPDPDSASAESSSSSDSDSDSSSDSTFNTKLSSELAENRCTSTGLPQLLTLPDIDAYAKLQQSHRERLFWHFVCACIEGPGNAVLGKWVLGGASCFLPDSLAMARHVFSQRVSFKEQLWNCFICVWLGCGGPAFTTWMYITGAGTLHGVRCPRHAQLPKAGGELDALYVNLSSFVHDSGKKPGTILAGDGRYTLGRFGGKQGLGLLQTWRLCFLDLVSDCNTDQELMNKIRDFGPDGLNTFLRRYRGFKELAIKEMFTYLDLVLPCYGDKCPYGGGAVAGGKLVMGADVQQDALHASVVSLLKRMPAEDAASISAALRSRVQELDKDLQRLPGIRSRLQASKGLARLKTLDVEICFCWWQAWLKRKTGKWKSFGRALWEARCAPE